MIRMKPKDERTIFFIYLAFLIIGAFILLECILRIFYAPPFIAQPFEKKSLSYKLGVYSDPANFKEGFPERQPGQKRILILGDSMLHGFQHRFNDVLNERMGLGKYHGRVLNNGGWGTDQEYLAFQLIGRQWEPDIVILAFCILVSDAITTETMWDVRRDIYKMHYFLFTHWRTYFYIHRSIGSLQHQPFMSDTTKMLDSEYDMKAFNCTFDINEPQKVMLTDHFTHLLTFVEHPQPSMKLNGESIMLQQYGYKLTFAIIDQLRKEVESYGGRFVLYPMPVANHFGWSMDNPKHTIVQEDGSTAQLDFMKPIKDITAWSKRHDITMINSTDKMNKLYGSGSELLFHNDNHYNLKGRKFIQEEICAFLKSIDSKVIQE